jgi:hypothetical protein
MKKVKFAAQIFILAAAFPVLFIAGISYPDHSKKVQPKIIETPSIKTGAKTKESKPVCTIDRTDAKAAYLFVSI